MTSYEISSMLKDTYENAHKNKAEMVHLFGIRFAEEIKENDISPKDIVKSAGLPNGYASELRKGINLAKYVEIKHKYE